MDERMYAFFPEKLILLSMKSRFSLIFSQMLLKTEQGMQNRCSKSFLSYFEVVVPLK
jgi:hypothetical protein